MIWKLSYLEHFELVRILGIVWKASIKTDQNKRIRKERRIYICAWGKTMTTIIISLGQLISNKNLKIIFS